MKQASRRLICSLSELKQCRQELLRCPQVAVDIEALKGEAGCLGKASLIQFAGMSRETLMLGDKPATYIVDVLSMNNDQISEHLGPVLESPTSLKLFYDHRGDSKVLYEQFDIKVPNTHKIDIQLMVTIDRWLKWGCPHRLTLDKALHQLGVEPPPPNLKKRMSSGEEVWQQRPLDEELIEYAASGVESLFALWRANSKYHEMALRLGARHINLNESDEINTVKKEWLREIVGPPGACTNCNQPGHEPDACQLVKVCSYCGKFGHREETCFQKPNQKDVLKCTLCNAIGHTAQHCYAKGKVVLICSHCGEKGHNLKFCRHRIPCEKCGKYGHLTKNCRNHSGAVTKPRTIFGEGKKRWVPRA
eukprot:TRINITY_DN17591_c0_g1_i1.p1 TRINITY_DN17591_c0_g1~~TRINITY_DN17591_c0_g1_i1.p1  ORF type:complete len:377 (+),score=68.02 TRINITY_DN17591_c0_g1_i1:48-1133(+)